jgi:hypothetical protein
MLMSLPATAFAQAGSTGGTIGKQDKSVSGDNGTEQLHSRTKPPKEKTGTPTQVARSCRDVVGDWLWSNGVNVTVNPDHTTTQSDGYSTRVTCADGVYTFSWPVITARMTLSSNGNRLSGTWWQGSVFAVRR